MNSNREVVGGEVLCRVGEQLDNESPRGRDTAALRAQCVERSRCLVAQASTPLLNAREVQLQGVRIWRELWISQLRCS